MEATIARHGSRTATAGWLVLVLGVEIVFAVADYVLEGAVIVGALVFGPLIASVRLGARHTAVVTLFAIALALVVTAASGGMDDAEQRIASTAVVVLGSLLAIHLARLREEREAAGLRLVAQHAVARIGVEAATLSDAAPRMLRTIGESLGWDLAALWEVEPGATAMRRVGSWHVPGVDPRALEWLSGTARVERGAGLPGRVWTSREPAWVADLHSDPGFARASGALAAGLRSAVAFPTRSGERVLGAIELFSRRRREPDVDLLELMSSFGAQVGQYVEAKRAEDAVRDSEALKSAILASALDCVITMDHKGRVVEFNPAAELTFGRRREDAIGHEMAELIIPPALREQHRRGLARYLETGEAPVLESGRLELTGMRADGSEFPVELAVQRIAGSEPPLFAGYLRDITDRKAAERALRRSRDELDGILGNLADGVTVQDRSGALVYANAAAARTIGYDSIDELLRAPLEEIMGRFELFDEHGEPLAAERLPGRQALAGERPEDIVVRFRVRATGAESWSIVKATPVRDEGGAVVRAINIFEDISVHKRTEIAQRFLAESGRLLGASLDYATTLRSVAQVAVPSFADWCGVDILRDDGSIERVAIAHADPAKVELAEEASRRYPPDASAERGVAHVLRSGKSELHPAIPDELIVRAARDAEHLALIRSLGMRSAMIVPLPAWRGTIGAITFVNAESGRAFDEHDLALAEEVGRRAATAIENARLYGERAYIARTLQQSLLPPHLPEIPGLEVAARYRAAGEGNEVGGDFYDLFDMGDANWAILIGDVCGKGADAAATTALARYTLRAAAMRERSPSRVLGQLNEALLRQRDDRQFCTVAYGIAEVGPHGVELLVACGGHPAPLIVRRDGSVEVTPAGGTLLGVVPDPELQEAALGLSPGDSLVLYTDGVTEARTGGELFGSQRLATVAAGAAGRSASEMARRIEEAAAAGELRDDLAILVLRVPEGGNGRVALGAGAAETALPVAQDAGGLLIDVRLPAGGEAIRSARHAIERLERIVHAERLDDLRLLVSELVTNGLRHGRPDRADWIGLRVRRGDERLRVEVSDPGGGFEAAAVRQVEPDATGGWGLYLVDRLAARWGVQRGERTSVWFELRTD